jgi:hypothetical protein
MQRWPPVAASRAVRRGGSGALCVFLGSWTGQWSPRPPRRRTPMERYLGLDAHGLKLHLRSDRPERPQDPARRGGDERCGLGSVREEPSGAETSVPRGGDAERLVVRDPVAACGGDRGRGPAREEPGSEGRPPRCVSAGRRAAHEPGADLGVQGAAQLRLAAGAQPGAHDAGAGCGPSAEPSESDVPGARHPGRRQDRLLSPRARGLAGEASGGPPRPGSTRSTTPWWN